MKTLPALLLICLFSGYISSQWVNSGSLTGTGTNYPSVSVVDENVVWFSGGTAGTPILWRSTNNGANFSQVPPPPCFEITSLYAKSSTECFAGDGGSSGAAGGNAKLYRTTNAGVNWVLVDQTGGASGFFLDIVFSKVNTLDGVAFSNPPNGTGQAYRVLKTTDGGNNWAIESPAGVSGSLGVWHCGIIYDASAYGIAITGGFLARVYGTTDAGMNWTAFPLLISGNPVTAFAYSDVSATALAGTGSVVARTTDQGLSWQTVNSGGASCIRWIYGTDFAYFMSSGLVKKSTDDGATWSTMTIAGGVTGLKQIDFAKVGNVVYGFGIASDGTVIKITDNLTGINQVGTNVPDRFRLYQNYPNPFNPSTKIKFDIPVGTRHGEFVQIRIYDILGKEVSALVDAQFLPSGTYEVEWDAPHFSSGVYYCVFTAGDFRDVIKMNLVK